MARQIVDVDVGRKLTKPLGYIRMSQSIPYPEPGQAVDLGKSPGDNDVLSLPNPFLHGPVVRT